MDNYPNHFILVFDLTSTQEASHDFIHPELTNCSISVQLTFDGALAANKKILFLGERSSTFYLNSERKVTKNSIITYQPMNSYEIRYLMGKCIHLKYYFYGVFAADNFPKLKRKGFCLVNAFPAQYEGSHWMVILFHENKVYMADPLGISLQNYQILYSGLVQFYNEVTQVLKFKPVQNQNSKLCGIFCVHIAYVMFGYGFPLMLNINDND